VPVSSCGQTRSATHFQKCKCRGSRHDISTEAVDAVRKAGYQTAVTTETGLNTPGADPFQLRRIGVDPTFGPHYFAQCAAVFRQVRWKTRLERLSARPRGSERLSGDFRQGRMELQEGVIDGAILRMAGVAV
jgi:hypothetical protein